MALRVYNSLTNRKEPFLPLEENRVRMYACGVTVYDRCHIGHGMQAIVYDTIRRYLRFLGYEVLYVRNHTDVDDKILDRAAQLGVDPLEHARRMIALTEEDMAALGVEPADVEPKVTDHIPDIIALIERLVEKGFAYPSGGSVYFSVRKFPEYGKLSNRKIEELEVGARIEIDAAKADPLDFALWKGAKPGELSWPSPWGPGRPGWHIECSALSMRYLGETFDIHGGGRDLIFPHHENEIAQSEAATGRPLARYWIHNGLVTVNKQKMAKSLGNFYLIHDLVQRFSPLVVRYTILTNHYASNVDFNPQAYRQAYKRLDYFYTTLEKIDRFIETTPEGSEEILDPERVSAIERRFVEAMDDDFNTAAAIAALSEPFRYANELLAARKPKGKDRVATLREIRAALTRVGEVLGLFQDPPAEVLRRLHDDLARELKIDTAWVEATIAERDAARKAKDWKRADELRDRLAERGIALLDTPTGTTWKVDLSHFPETP